MGNGEIDRFPVSQLPARYILARSAVYTRLKALGVRPQKISNRAYVNAEQLRWMDDLHQFIQSGGTTAEFLERRRWRQANTKPSGLSSEPSADLLERAARNGWLLVTSEIADLLNLPPSSIQKYDDRFSEAGFIFTRVGYLSQGEIAWRVSDVEAA
ncbi:MAG: hypothetical protein MJA27_11740 [Pseudanabaenales cyanobacterium]|nr:hypothetical protein [Pseudanabaenales cyanobacterium]